MSSSVNTSIDNVYKIMGGQSNSMKNLDSQKALNLGADLQQSVQEVQAEKAKGSNETAKQIGYKINIMV